MDAYLGKKVWSFLGMLSLACVIACPVVFDILSCPGVLVFSLVLSSDGRSVRGCHDAGSFSAAGRINGAYGKAAPSALVLLSLIFA